MKENWTYKKLGELGMIVTGSTPTTKNEAYYSSNDYCFIKPSDLPSDGYTILTKSEFYISARGYEVSRKLPKGAVLVSCIGIIGKTAILGIDACTNQQINSIIPNETTNNRFLAYSILSQRFKLQSVANAPVVPLINKGDFSKIQIPIPPLSTQQSIVAELDEINNLLQLKKKELEIFDKLAQSIFYEMFGDPVTNEKGWEVKRIGEIGRVERGAGISKKDFVENGLPCIHYGQLHTSFGPYTKVHLTCIPENLLTKYRIAQPGDLLMAITSEDVEGSCKSTAWLGEYDIVVGSDAAVFHHSQNGIYLSYYTMTKAFYNEKAKYAKGFKVTHISTKEIESIPILLPPLSLQQTFATRIEATEQQKELVKASINKLETLLASRMQYWFD